MYEIIGNLFDRAPILSSSVNLSSSNSNKLLSELAWDPTKMGLGITLSDGGSSCFIKEQSYVFRSVIANIGFTNGVNYWEIIADPNT